jgi:NCS1 family nucleobase:cation symporter-1
MAEQLAVSGPVRLDTTGIEPIEEAARDSTPWQQFWLWFGANITPTSWVVGAIGPELGLSLVQSLLVMFIGQVAGALLFGFFTLMGRRTGVAQLTLGRATFGILGNRGPAFIQGLVSLAWVGVNTYVVLSSAGYVLHSLGLPDNKPTQYGVAAVIMIIQVLIGTLGFYAIQAFEKYTVPVMAALMIAMTVLACVKGHIVWNHSIVHGSARWTAVSELMTASGIGWGASWIGWASDYSRFTAKRYSAKRLYSMSVVATAVPLLWLGGLGAAMASGTASSDPAQLVASLFGVMTIPVLLILVHGAVAVNVESIYSTPLCFLAGGLKLKRWAGSLVSAVLATLVLIAFLASASFASSFTNYMNSFVVWTAAWGAVVGVDYFVIKRSLVDTAELYKDPKDSAYGGIRYRAVISLVAGIVAGWVFEYGAVPAFQGPMARAMNGVDLSWLASIVVGGGLYLLLARREPAYRAGLTGERAGAPAGAPLAEAAE